MAKKGSKEVSVQVVPQSGKSPKARTQRVMPGMTAQQVLDAMGISGAGKTLSFGGKPVAVSDVLFTAGQKLTGGNVLQVTEHAAGS